jgi:hypothetical protein
LRAYTLDDIVWGDIATPLTDSVYYDNPQALRTFHDLLANGSDELHRAYLNLDVHTDFTDSERAWYGRLSDMLDFLAGFPFPDVQTGVAEYERRVQLIVHLASLSPPPARLGEETIYHLVLREVTAIVTHVEIYMRGPLLHNQRLVARVPYAAFTPPERDMLDQMPDVRESLAWAKHALAAIAGDDWLLIMWQVGGQHYNLSLQ